MKHLALVLALAAISSARGRSEKAFRYNGNGYGYFTIGGCQHGYALYGGGGGGEALVWRGLTVGGEGGYQKFSDGWGFGTLFGDVGYHSSTASDPEGGPFRYRWGWA